MKYFLQNTFWIMGTNKQGAEKFFPIVFSESLTSVFFINDEEWHDLSSQVSQESLKEIIESCMKHGAQNFIAPESSNLNSNITIYHSKALYLKALKHGCFKNLPLEVKSFVENNNAKIDKTKFDEFCANQKMSRKVILEHKRAFKRATKFIDEAGNLENDCPNKNLEHVCDYSELRRTLDGFYVSKTTNSNEEDTVKIV